VSVRTTAAAYQEHNKCQKTLTDCKAPMLTRICSVAQDLKAIESLLHSYQNALNEASTEDVSALYAPDGVIMPQHSESGVGTEAIRKAYDKFFELIKFDVKFDIKEIVPTAPDWAFARTSSEGTTDVQGRGVGHEANQELFVFQKVGGDWKIAR